MPEMKRLYFGIYPPEVWEIITKDLPKLKSDLEAI
jgi:uncharacterized protein with HEPN domain